MSNSRPQPESDVESEEGCEWLLGFVEPPRKRTDLLRHRFPSKVGGRPAWLDPLHLPTEEQLTCRVTGQPLDFLLQVYAPIDDNPAAFHRTLFLFLSPAGDKLAQAGTVRALRCQLPRANPFYPPDPPTKTDVLPPQLPDDERRASLARDRWRVLEAERQPAAAQQPAGGGGGTAAELAVGGGGGAAVRLYPEAELVVEPEQGASDDDGSGRDEHVRRLVQQYQAAAQQGAYSEEELPGSLVEELEGRIDPEQAHFAAFQARLGAEPGQCLRYCFDAAAQPLWPSSKNVPGPADIPPCERCGGPRQFEFQVMPQLIVHLGVPADDPAAPDWGTIAVYSCAAACGGGGGGGGMAASPDESAYVEEFVWVQESS